MQTSGNQRLSVEKLQNWEALGYGMFVCYGMSTYDGDELSAGNVPSTTYAPNALDVDQWISVARDSGMKYAVLTAKHHSGHCLWPSRLTDYHIGTSGNHTDVVEAFVNACEKKGVLPGLYYACWDNHHKFGSVTPSMIASHSDFASRESALPILKQAYTTQAYLDFQTAQLQELLTQYGKIAEVWIDIPGVVPRGYRHDLYDQIAVWQPETVVMMNNGYGDGTDFDLAYAWPTDLIAMERALPPSKGGHTKWRDIEGKQYYLPGEVCDPLGQEWFAINEDQPRSDEELLGMYLLCRTRAANLLLALGPDKSGVISQHYIDALQRLRKNIDRFTVG